MFTWLRKEKREKKGRKENKGKTKEKPREKRKEKREKGRGSARQQGDWRERGHGSKEKEEKSPASHPGQPRAAVVGNAVSRQNRPFSLFLNIALKTFFLNDFE